MCAEQEVVFGQTVTHSHCPDIAVFPNGLVPTHTPVGGMGSLLPHILAKIWSHKALIFANLMGMTWNFYYLILTILIDREAEYNFTNVCHSDFLLCELAFYTLFIFSSDFQITSESFLYVF